MKKNHFNKTNYLNRPLSVISNLGKPITLIILSLIKLLIFLVSALAKTQTHRKRIKASSKPILGPLKFIFNIIKLTTISLTVAVVAISIYLYIHLDLAHLPSPQTLLTSNPPITTRIYDRNGVLLYQLYQDQNRTPVTIADLPSYVVQSHLAIEDKNYYYHHGVSLPDILRAAYQNLHLYKCLLSVQLTHSSLPNQSSCESPLQGASTITQQLIKNSILTPERTWERKIKEIILAIQIERQFTKDQILEMYLNRIAYGGTAYGIEAASRTYFGKSAKDLNLSEAALLAALPQAPSTYSPFASMTSLSESITQGQYLLFTQLPEPTASRQQLVLQKMLEQNYITLEQYQQAIQQPLQISLPKTDIQAPHFVMYLKNLLENTYGPSEMYYGGLEIHTTLDLSLQHFAEQTLNQELSKLKNLNVTNGAVLIIKPTTGEILAMVGSRDYFDTTHNGNVNATIANRQPGSSIKPLTYATALSLSIPSPFVSAPPLHYTPASIINDIPITFKIAGSQDYTPKNYDGKFHGPVTVRTALASSYNIPAVKTLNEIGVEQLVDMGKKLGITTWDDPSRYGLSLTLGAGEVKMTELATVYSTFANLGKSQPLNPIISINRPYLNSPTPTPPAPFENMQPQLDPRVAFLINHILSDNQARIPAFGSYSKLNIPNHVVAVKTGTSNELRDNWTIGYTPDYLVAVWVGNFDNTPMSRIASGITGATPIWNNIMTHLLNEYDPTLPEKSDFPWSPPEGLVQVPICSLTGQLACNGCPTKQEWFIQGTEPTRHCSPEQFLPKPSPSDLTSLPPQQTPQVTVNQPTPTHTNPFLASNKDNNNKRNKLPKNARKRQ